MMRPIGGRRLGFGFPGHFTIEYGLCTTMSCPARVSPVRGYCGHHDADSALEAHELPVAGGNAALISADVSITVGVP